MLGEFQRPPSAMRLRFIEEFIACNNAHEAAIAAGYSPRTAKVQGSLLLRDPRIASAIRARLNDRAERTRIAGDRIVLELARVAFSDIARIADWDGASMVVRASSEMPESDRAAIARVTKRGNEVQVVLHDKIRALDTLGKYFKLWGKHADKFGPDGLGGRIVDPETLQRHREQARNMLRIRIDSAIRARQAGEREVKLREEEEWAAAWRHAFGPAAETAD